MRVTRTSLAVLAAGALALPAMAQTPGAGQSGLVPPASWAAGDLGCAPYLIVAPPDAGLQVVPWTANTPADWQKLADAGVDAIISDDPAALIGWLKAKGLR